MRYIKESLYMLKLVFILSLALCACDRGDGNSLEKDGEEYEKSPVVVVTPVTNLKAETTQKANELRLSWNVSSDIAMVEIAYWMDGAEESEAITEKVRGNHFLLITVNEHGLYHISATALDNYGRRSEVITITATPAKEDAPTEIVQVNSKLPIADPYCFYHDGMYYAYGTGWASGFPVYTSTDLVHWFEARALQNTDSWGAGKNTWWAPEVYEFKNLFYMFYVIDEHICVAYSVNGPIGLFRQNEKLPLMPSEKNIDPHLFIDDDGTPYLYFVRFTGGNVIWVAEMNADLKSIKENTLTECIRATDEWELQQGNICEGPSVIKRNGMYYLLYSANHYQCKDYAVGYATSDSPVGPWKKYEGNPILRRDKQAAGGLAGVGHGAPFRCADGSWKYIFHAHEFADKSEVGKRTSYINDLHFSANGEISISGELISPVVVEEHVVE